MIHANLPDVESCFSHFLGLVKSGEKVTVCEGNVPVAEIVAVSPPVDRARRAAAFGMFAGMLTDAQIEEATRPMTDEEADAFVEGRY